MSDQRTPETPGTPTGEEPKLAPELLGDWRRTDLCGRLRRDAVGRDALIMGWVQRTRDLGGWCSWTCGTTPGWCRW